VVASGWALAAAGQSDLAAAERSARMAHLGLWAAQ
jgi:endonuclease YncB( thermonuclease family)